MCTRKGHLEAIDQIRQMMAEEKFIEAQKMIEVQLKLTSSPQYPLLKLYFECLIPQNKSLQPEQQMELAEKSFENNDFKLASQLLEEKISDRYFSRITKLKLKLLEVNGNFDEMYKCLSGFLIRLFEFQIPCLPEWLKDYSEKYFKNDFGVNLKLLSIHLMINDLKRAEDILKNIIISSVEASQNRALKEKINAVTEVLINASNKGRLEIYQNFCQIFGRGIQDKSEYKKLIETIIYFEEFKFQVLTLDLLLKLNLDDIAIEYSTTVRSNKEYSFVYLEKFYPHLKKLFIKKTKAEAISSDERIAPEIELTEMIKFDVLPPAKEYEAEVDVIQYKNILKYQNYDTLQLCDLAVSFIQSEMPRVALCASELAELSAINDNDFLKASYLKLTCQILINDYRAAIDTSIEALKRAKSQEDILSFLYSQAEAYIRINLKSDARRVLKNIIEIDEKYRLAKERLEKLNEV
jgi:hypothetical protein